MMTTLHPPRALPSRELIVPVLATAVTVVMPLLVRGRLPDPVAIHWGLDGRPDGSAPLAVDAVLLAVATGLVTILPVVAAARADRRIARTMLALAHGMAALFLLLRWRTLQLNLDVAVWTDAGALTLVDLAIGLVAVVPAALLGWWLGGRHPELARPVREVVPVPLPADGQLLWVGHQAWSVARVLGPSVVVIGALVTAVRLAPETLILGGSLMLTGLLLWWFTAITVAAGPAGLKVRFGPVGWPAVRVPLATIEHVEVEDVEPMAYGGWGYRVMPGVRAVVIRRGVGLRVRRAGRPDLVVTVDDAATAAGVLVAHLATQGPGPGGAGGSE